MAASLSLFKVVFLVVLFFMGNADANICQEPSKTFKGPCVEQAKCTSACQSEGFQFGECSNSICYCTKPCPPNNQ
ncbi:hypothetical protein EJD97_002978 [Solanum chilense]|uniref:Knottins-like domain-containing protein n=1 Tax=Solanum chilense TaxID=4083 RepID=A0A6N2ATC3_SOLCI|nr:hypothetical protein EJD97_002978 [Solanum chilense]